MIWRLCYRRCLHVQALLLKNVIKVIPGGSHVSGVRYGGLVPALILLRLGIESCAGSHVGWV